MQEEVLNMMSEQRLLRNHQLLVVLSLQHAEQIMNAKPLVQCNGVVQVLHQFVVLLAVVHLIHLFMFEELYIILVFKNKEQLHQPDFFMIQIVENVLHSLLMALGVITIISCPELIVNFIVLVVSDFSLI